MRPAYLSLSAATTLPMSLIELAPTSAIAALIASADLGFAQLLWQIARDHHDLAPLLLGEIGTVVLLIDVERFLAALDHFLQHGEHVGV